MSRINSDWIRAYVEHTDISEAPTQFHFWAGVSTIAGVLRRRVWIDMRHFQWTPNFYIILVAPPGVATKSTAMRKSTELLREIKGIQFGPQSMTWQSLTESLAKTIESVDYPTKDGRMEKKIMSCINIHISELGTFLRTEDGPLIDALTDLYDGQLTTWKHSTKTQGDTEIKNPWINFIGCTTPSWLANHFPEHMIGGGLTSRIIFVYADKKRRLIPYPSDLILQEDYAEQKKALLSDLTQIAQIKGEYILSPEAKQLGAEWYEEHWTRRPVHLASDRYGGYVSRKQTHIHKLAIVLTAARTNKLVIEYRELKNAMDLISGIEEDMIKVFESVGVPDESKALREIVAYVKTHGTLTSHELWKLCINVMPKPRFEAALKIAVEGDYLKVVTKDGKKAVQVMEK